MKNKLIIQRLEVLTIADLAAMLDILCVEDNCKLLGLKKIDYSLVNRVLSDKIKKIFEV